MLVKCEICGKSEEFPKKNVKLFAKWLEIEPDRFICRDCEQIHVWPNIIQFKLIDPYRSLKEIPSKKEKES